MSQSPDALTRLVSSGIGKELTSRLGLPTPVALRRHTPGDPLITGRVLVASLPGATLADEILGTLASAGAQVAQLTVDPDGTDPIEITERVAAVILDVSGVATTAGLDGLWRVLHDGVRRLDECGRVIVFGTTPAEAEGPRGFTAQMALTGFTRSVAKELREGSTANLVYVDPDATAGLGSTLRFFLSGRSAYVNGQTVRVGPGRATAPQLPADWDQPLSGQSALVTGAARGIGLAIAETLSRDGAEVVLNDLPSMGEELTKHANRLGGSSLQLDITDENAAERVARHGRERFDGFDLVVHNAGVTRDKTIAGMDAKRWNLVMAINIASQESIDEALLDEQDGATGLTRGGAIVCVSSMSGIAGNRGQTNYGASKAAVIGHVEAMAPVLAKHGGASINAVAPGFIETDMTAEMPVVTREVGRRINSLSQGGLPVDVAETIGWLGAPAARWINGQTIRVCGQSLLGA